MHYALPIGQISGETGASSRHIEVEVGMGVHDTLWTPLQQSVETKNMPASRDPTAAVIDYVSLVVPADSYQVAVHARPLNGTMLSGYKTARRVDQFEPGLTSMSDLLLAYEIRPATQPGKFNRNGLSIRVNPFLVFSRSNPVFAYFELYDLALDRNDRTKFTVEYRLQPRGERRGVRRLFRRRTQPSLTLRFDREGTSTSPAEWGEIDVSRVDAGEYELFVTVTDELTGKSVTRSTALELTD
jgi:hypothetical protein